MLHWHIEIAHIHQNTKQFCNERLISILYNSQNVTIVDYGVILQRFRRINLNQRARGTLLRWTDLKCITVKCKSCVWLCVWYHFDQTHSALYIFFSYLFLLDRWQFQSIFNYIKYVQWFVVSMSTHDVNPISQNNSNGNLIHFDFSVICVILPVNHFTICHFKMDFFSSLFRMQIERYVQKREK